MITFRSGILVLVLAFVIGTTMAAIPVGHEIRDSGRHVTTLDEQCIIDFIGFTYGTYSGNMTWPGGSGQYRMTGFMFLNSCAPGETLFTYCVDLDHPLYNDPYCVEINEAVVRPAYAEQYPAMAYVLTWYPVTNDFEDRVQQLTIWKLTDDMRPNSPNYLVPFYHTNAGRGYPNPSDPPAYPYVNTVFNSDNAVNLPACDRVRYALGATDGIPKNVVISGDAISLSFGPATINAGFAEVPVTAHLTRGAHALSLGNSSLSGVRLLIATDHGVLSNTDMFTDAAGNIQFTLTQSIIAPDTAHVVVCSYGTWPVMILPCDENGGEQRLVQAQQSGASDTICAQIEIPADNFLSVELTSFEALAADEGVLLKWTTASELNALRWEIERSEAGRSDFRVIATVPAASSLQGHRYEYLDRSVIRGLQYDYRLVDVEVTGTRTIHEQVRTAGVAPVEAAPLEYVLADNYPNPFNPQTIIRFSIANDNFVRLTVHDALGQETALLVARELKAGQYEVAFNGGNLPSGVYFYTLSTSEFSMTKKMVLMK